jgi:hypothetical protein
VSWRFTAPGTGFLMHVYGEGRRVSRGWLKGSIRALRAAESGRGRAVPAGEVRTWQEDHPLRYKPLVQSLLDRVWF